jgi:glycosyltransferase A (GT-A) superfamily protein (DUF2064 family)
MAWTLPEDAVLGIYGERPDVDRAGSPLAGEWGPDRAAEIREAMLFDALDLWDSPEILSPGGRRVLVYGPSDAGPWFDERVPASFAMQPQTDGDRGRRIDDFLIGELEEAGRVVAIIADAPTLDPAIVMSAFLCLEGRDIVLGPATDGGCYLVGARGEVPPLFQGVDSGRPDVLSRVMDRLADTGQSVAVLPPWYVVENPDQLRMLAGHLRALRRAGFDPRVPRLERLLQGMRSDDALSSGG